MLILFLAFYLQYFQEPRQPVHWCATSVKLVKRWKLVLLHVPPPEHRHLKFTLKDRFKKRKRRLWVYHGPWEPKLLRDWTVMSLTLNIWLAMHVHHISFSSVDTCCVCQDVPEAMFVRAQAASNCRVGSSSIDRKETKRDSKPASMISFRGGLRSWESSFLWQGWRKFYNRSKTLIFLPVTFSCWNTWRTF